MKNDESLSRNIVDTLIKSKINENDEKKVNISQLSKNTGIQISSLWCYLNGKRKWPADHFLRILVEIGEATIIDNHLIINIEHANKTIINKSLNQSRKKKWTK